MSKTTVSAPKAHALLGASSAARWLVCSPSARMCENVPETESLYAAEGDVYKRQVSCVGATSFIRSCISENVTSTIFLLCNEIILFHANRNLSCCDLLRFLYFSVSIKLSLIHILYAGFVLSKLLVNITV